MAFYLMLTGFAVANGVIVKFMDGTAETIFSGALLGVAYSAAYALGKTGN